jgi:hypothetical protein
MLTMPSEELASRALALAESDHEHIQAATRALVNLIFHEQIDKKFINQRVIPAEDTGGEHRFWNHSQRVKQLIDDHHDGRVKEALDANFSLRDDMLRMTSAFMERYEATSGREGERQRSLYDAIAKVVATSESFQSQRLEENDLSVAERIRRRFGVKPQLIVTLDTFRSLCMEGGELQDLNLDDETIELIFKCVDSDGSGQATLQEFANLFSALAPPELLAERSMSRTWSRTRTTNSQTNSVELA